MKPNVTFAFNLYFDESYVMRNSNFVLKFASF